jgi:hypothetical protein
MFPSAMAFRRQAAKRPRLTPRRRGGVPVRRSATAVARGPECRGSASWAFSTGESSARQADPRRRRSPALRPIEAPALIAVMLILGGWWRIALGSPVLIAIAAG